jgi:hypothetical protein
VRVCSRLRRQVADDGRWKTDMVERRRKGNDGLGGIVYLDSATRYDLQRLCPPTLPFALCPLPIHKQLERVIRHPLSTRQTRGPPADTPRRRRKHARDVQETCNRGTRGPERRRSMLQAKTVSS